MSERPFILEGDKTSALMQEQNWGFLVSLQSGSTVVERSLRASLFKDLEDE